MDGPVVAFDLQRMLVGTEPLAFHLEIIVRTVIVYAYALALLRWLGSRTVGQLSTVEFLLVIALGSAVGDPMFYPEVPLLHALLVVSVIVLANKALDVAIARSKRAERLIDGRPAELIENGIISRRFLESMTFGQSEIFQQLRRRGIENLGQVRFAFVEPDGAITVFRHEGEPAVGLPIVPPWGIRSPVEISSHEPVQADSDLACMNCGFVGNTAAGQAPGACANCRHERWTPALRSSRSNRETSTAG